ncbi:MAG: exodeoxyribonuclease VII large subunit [Bacteroidetes bacterium]|jgi:exodeoxyribonuclease VII large subunit|nr:exodeoxyribonuclease VII large subunit [Bacteroidota bacterium]
MSEQALSLLELNHIIRQKLTDALDPLYWVVAEISDIKINARGHCYLELVDKPEDSDDITARSRAVIWNRFFRLIQPYFETTTRQPLSEGIKIMVKVSVDFHELYGLSLNIKDIDPTYTLGDLARQKQDILNRLMEEGVMEMNKQLLLPLLPKKIAVISSEQAAGYQDFVNQLDNNIYGYTFYHQLFPAVMQGKETEETIIHALESVYNNDSFFDVVVIIRGGGAQADLNSFNTYWLAYHIAQFPIPVLTGIGHEKDDTIVDMVAHTRLKTPTAVAGFLIDRILEADEHLQYLTEKFYTNIENILDVKKMELTNLVQGFYYATQQYISRQNFRLMAYEQTIQKWPSRLLKNSSQYLKVLADRMKRTSREKLSFQRFKVLEYSNKLSAKNSHYINSKKRELEQYTLRTKYLDPKNVLKRGYSITFTHNKLVKSAADVEKGSNLKTLLQDGEINSTAK